jgi:two-component system cell cycle response regulator DivK
MIMNGSILVVDDNLDNLAVTQILLEGEGFEVRLAEDAPQAVDILKTFRPKLILMDIQLPGMDGLELTRHLRRDHSFDEIAIVALSAYAMKGDEENALAAGCGGYITKPIDTRTFADEVRKYLAAPDPSNIH